MGECYFCESDSELEDHHIVPQRFQGSDSKSNIVTLCHDCHWKLERLYNKDFWEAIGIEDPRTTQEKHITCEYHGCTSQATEKCEIAGIGGGGKITSEMVYRCDDHHPDEIEKEENKLKSGRRGLKSTESASEKLRYVRREVRGELYKRPCSKFEIRSMSKVVPKIAALVHLDDLYSDIGSHEQKISKFYLKYSRYWYKAEFEERWQVSVADQEKFEGLEN